MVDFSLSEQQLAIQKTARDFAEKEIKPLADDDLDTAMECAAALRGVRQEGSEDFVRLADALGTACR